jgi:hypothetical protein
MVRVEDSPVLYAGECDDCRVDGVVVQAERGGD